jgi:hypothetical protein
MNLVALLLAFAAQSKNPEYDHWADCKVGSWTKIKIEGEVGGQKAVMETTHTLLEMGKEKAIVERKMKMTMAGKEQPEQADKEDVPSGKDPNPVKIESEGDEELEVAGKKLKCHWIQGTQGESTKIKMWLSKEIPGGIAKGEITEPGQGSMKLITTSWEKK